MPPVNKKRKRLKDGASTDRYRRFREGNTIFISDDERGFLLSFVESPTNPHTFTFFLAELEPREDGEEPEIKHEIFRTTVYDKSETGATDALDFMAKELCKGKVDIDDPIDFAMILGGTIHGRTPLATTGVPKSQIH